VAIPCRQASSCHNRFTDAQGKVHANAQVLGMLINFGMDLPAAEREPQRGIYNAWASAIGMVSGMMSLVGPGGVRNRTWVVGKPAESEVTKWE
jgi:hypothetical protein